MSTFPVSRVAAGVPTGGQFATSVHAEPSLSLVTAEPEVRGALEIEGALAERLFERAEIAGRISDIEMDGGVYRAKLTTEDGREFGFSHGGQGLDIWRDTRFGDDHHGVSDEYYQAGDPTVGLTSDEVKDGFAKSRTAAVVADTWNAWSTVRSNENVTFELPRINDDGDAEMEFSLPGVDHELHNYRMVVPRGATEARVFDYEDNELSPHMSKAVLEDAAEAAGEKPDAEAVIFSTTRSLEPIVEGTW
ncbi:hypothetical protein [Arthrobacter sp. N1]|uniref:hypothetical protein n=1 Tax=Arthrobacter sp. N1 TaxID=619291 RepID=UPI003BAE5D75